MAGSLGGRCESGVYSLKAGVVGQRRWYVV